MELVGPPAPLELGGDLVDALGDNQHRPIDGLRQEVAEWTIEASREEHPFTVLSHERK